MDYQKLKQIVVFIFCSVSMFFFNLQPVNAGTNGQQVSIDVCYARQFTIGGYNQNDELIYRVEAADLNSCKVVSVPNFWWKGEISVSVVYFDNTTSVFRFNIPVDGSDWVNLTVRRNAAVERGASWLKIDPDYSWGHYINIENSILSKSQDIVYSPAFGYYRTDCSGFVSYAWSIQDIQAPDTVALHFGKTDSAGSPVTYSAPVAISNLLPGDIVINPESGANGHVILFVSWVDQSSLKFIGYDQFLWATYSPDGTLQQINDQGTRVLAYQFSSTDGYSGNLSAYYSDGYATPLAGTWFADRNVNP